MDRRDFAFGSHFSSLEQWECSFRDKGYQAKSSLKRHHTEVLEQPRQRALPPSSSRAVVSSSSKQKNREKHMERVERWKCKKCSKDYSSKASLVRHLTEVHDKPKQRALPASRDKEGSSRKRPSEDKSRKPSKVTNVVRKTTQVQNNTKKYTINIVNNFH